jgi:chromosome segregation ATPase
MKRRVNVGIFLAIVVTGAIIIAIFALSRSGESSPIPMEEYEENIRILNDTIKELKDDIAKYKLEIERIDLEREKIKKELELIIKDNEKIDTELSNGDWDTNIEFLSRFLSEEDTLEK